MIDDDMVVTLGTSKSVVLSNVSWPIFGGI